MPARVEWNTARAAEIIASESGRDGPLLPILHALQAEFGYVAREAEPMIAEALNITRAEVHGVATFYHDFRREPAGEHVLRLCRAEACQAAGCDALIDHAERALGTPLGTTAPGGRVTLEAVYCLGLCALGPSAMLDGKVVARLDTERLDALIAEVAG